MSLYIDSLKLRNYRQYKDTTIEFSRKPKKMFTVLRGINGAGKTNIMNAITWCLYGEENRLDTSDDNKDQSRLPIINKEVLRKSQEHDEIKMCVELSLVDEDGTEIEINRSLTLYNNSKTVIRYDKSVGAPIPMGSKPSVEAVYRWFRPNGGGWKIIDDDDFDNAVEELLPQNLSGYYLFDGEQLEDFFSSDKNVKIGIENVTQIGVVQDAIVRLEKIRSRKIRNSKKIQPDVKLHDVRLNNTREKLNEIKAKINEVELETKAKEARRSQITNRLKRFDNMRELINEEESLQGVINRLVEKHDEINANIRKHVLEYAGYMQAYPAISKTLRIIEEKVSTGVLPPDISDTFLMKLLESNRCICGSNISMGRARDLVEEQLGRAKYTPAVNTICTTLEFELKKVKAADVQTKLHELEEGEDRLEKELREKGIKQRQLKNKLKDVDKTKTMELVEEREILDVKVKELHRKLGRNEKDEERTEAKLQAHEHDLNLAMEKSKRLGGIEKEVRFCTKSLDGLKAAQQKLIMDVRTKVEENTEKFFLNSIWKKDSFNNVKIDENYMVTAVDKHGHSVREDLSSGEKMILALAFMAALRKVTDLKFPLIIDTPLGRISGETRYNLANVLPDSLVGDQVVLLVTDTEYQGDIRDDDGRRKFPPVRNIIDRYVGKDFDIIHDSESSEVRKHE